MPSSQGILIPAKDRALILAPHLLLPAAGLCSCLVPMTGPQSILLETVGLSPELALVPLPGLCFFPPLLPLLGSAGGRWALKFQSI